MLRFQFWLPVLLWILLVPAAAVMPVGAEKYYSVLLDRPHQQGLFELFEGSWLDQGTLEELEDFLRQEAVKDGGSSWVLLARYYLGRGQDDQALVAMAEALRGSPNDGRMRIVRARVKLRHLEFLQAAEDLEWVRKLGNEDLELEASMMLGKVLLRAGDQAGALRVWEQTLLAHPSDEDLLDDLVELAAAGGELSQAVVFLDRLIKESKDPYRRAWGGIRRGELLGQMGEFEGALQSYDETLALVGEGSWLESELLARMGNLFREGEKSVELMGHLLGLAKIYPNRLEIQRRLAKLEVAAGEVDQAIGRFRLVLRRNPGVAALREEFVRMLSDADRLDDAVLELENLIEHRPGEAELLLQLAALRHRQDNGGECLAALKRAMDQMEGGSLRVAGLMFEYALEGEGERLLKELIEDEAPGALETLADYFGRVGRVDEAVELWLELVVNDDLDTVLRAVMEIGKLGEPLISYERLKLRYADFSRETKYLEALVRRSIELGQADQITSDAVRLVRMFGAGRELVEAVKLAARAIVAAGEEDRWLVELKDVGGDACLKAELWGMAGDFQMVEKIFGEIDDPAMLGFYAGLLQRRGLLGQALEVMDELWKTEIASKLSFLKEYARMQRQAGDLTAALATVTRWQQQAPGDRSARRFGVRLLWELGRGDEAIAEARKAVAKFEDDKELLLLLVELYQECGEFSAAEALLWRECVQAGAWKEKSRWITKLGQVSMKSGHSEEWAEKLDARIRNNRRSVVPLLARAELAREMRDDEKVQELYQQALRLSPKDPELRIQVSRVAEKQGAGELAIETLQGGVSHSDRVRRELAQLYLRVGELQKGMKLMRSLDGGVKGDPRELCRTAESLALQGWYDEAIDLLRSGMEDGGDWQLRYLLAVMLEEDGREREAIEIFFELLHAEGELLGLAGGSMVGADAVKLLLGSRSRAYAHRIRQAYSWWVPGFVLPCSAADVRSDSLYHLLSLERSLGGEDSKMIGGFLLKAGIHDLVVLRSLAEGLDVLSLLDLHPKHPGLLTVFMENLPGVLIGSAGDIDPFAPKSPMILRNGTMVEGVPLEAKFKASLLLMDVMAASAVDCERFLELSRMISLDTAEVEQLAFDIRWYLRENRWSADLKGKMRVRLRELLDGDERLGCLGLEGLARLRAERALDRKTDVIQILNQEVIRFQELGGRNMTKSIPPGRSRSLTSMKWWLTTQMPAGDTAFHSLPEWIFTMFEPESAGDHDFPCSSFNELKAEDLLGSLERIESPVLRAWLAIASKDESAIRDAFGVEVSGLEARDMKLIRVQWKMSQEGGSAQDRFEMALELREFADADQDLLVWVDEQMFEHCRSFGRDQSKEYERELRAMLLRMKFRRTVRVDKLWSRAEALGYHDMADSFRGGWVVSSSRSSPGYYPLVRHGPGSVPPGGFVDPLDKIQELGENGQIKAAAADAWRLLRKTPDVEKFDSSFWSRIRAILGNDGVGKLLNLADPGETKSLMKRRRFACICGRLGAANRRLAILEKLRVERPHDEEIAVILAFSEGLDRARALELLAGVRGAEQIENRAAVAMQGGIKMTMSFFRRLSWWLESREQSDLDGMDLDWLNDYVSRVLWQGRSSPRKDNADRYPPVAKNLGAAMMRQSQLVEWGYRLLSELTDGEVSDGEMDSYAMQEVLMGLFSGSGNGIDDPFASSSHSPLISEGRPVSGWRWIASRLAMADELGDVLSGEFLEKVGAKKAAVVASCRLLAEVNDGESALAFWNAPEFRRLDAEEKITFLDAFMKRISRFEAAEKALVVYLGEIKPVARGEWATRETLQLIRHLLGASQSWTSEQRRDLSASIVRACFGDRPELSGAVTDSALWTRLREFEELLGSLDLSPMMMQSFLGDLYLAGVPVMDGKIFALPYRELMLRDAESAEAFFDQAGWFGNAGSWTPPGGWVYQKVRGFLGEEILVIPFLALTEASRWDVLDAGKTVPELLLRLERRKEGRFGVLMTMAALVPAGQQRKEYVVRAFAVAKEEIAGMKESELGMLMLAVDWLPKEERKKLGGPLGEMIRAEDAWHDE